MEPSTAFGATLSRWRSTSSAGDADADADATTPAAPESEGETREVDVQRKMRDSARKMRD